MLDPHGANTSSRLCEFIVFIFNIDCFVFCISVICSCISFCISVFSICILAAGWPGPACIVGGGPPSNPSGRATTGRPLVGHQPHLSRGGAPRPGTQLGVKQLFSSGFGKTEEKIEYLLYLSHQ